MTMQQATNSSWIEKLTSAKKAGLLQNGIFNFFEKKSMCQIF